MSLFNSGSAGATRPGPTQPEGGPMGLKEYEVVINGYETTVLLSDEDARQQGLLKSKADPSKEIAELRAKLAEAETKAAEAEERERAAVDALHTAKAESGAKAAQAANKQAPAPQNKSGSVAANKSVDPAAKV